MTYRTLALSLTLLTGCAQEDKDTASSADIDASGDAGQGDTAQDQDATVDVRFVETAADGASVEAVEPGRYLGLWYEIATTPSMQQTRCAGTTAEYSLRDDGLIG